MIEKNKTYLITGGTGVIGYSLCERILKIGGKVIVLSRSKKKLIELQKKYDKVGIIVGDVCDILTREGKKITLHSSVVQKAGKKDAKR